MHWVDILLYALTAAVGISMLIAVIAGSKKKKKKKKTVAAAVASSFKFRDRCISDNGGTVLMNESSDPDKAYSGTLLECIERAEYGKAYQTFASEIGDITAQIDAGTWPLPTSEKQRLEQYFSIVYPMSDRRAWERMSEDDLVAYFRDLEFYYVLPPQIMPATKIEVRRATDKQFYRVPKGVVLDQDPMRKGVLTPYVEVAHFGNNNNLFRDPRLFNGTYYYPAKGTGLYLPIGRTLVAYNKVHAMKMLDVLNADIARVGGKDFQAFLQADSHALWAKIQAAHAKDAKDATPLARGDYWVPLCVVDKTAAAPAQGCGTYLGVNTRQIYYIPAALDAIVAEMASGKSLRESRFRGGPKKLTYYGLGDVGDKFLAQTARNRQFDTVQFLREAQMSLQGDAVVGNEFLHLTEPVYSQASLARLDPFSRPMHVASDGESRFNYLLDATIPAVQASMVTDDAFDPWEETVDKLNIVVSERN